MAIWDYPEPNDEDEKRYPLCSREYDPDFEYEEARANREEQARAKRDEED
jgi:hypothetical protein